MIQIYMSQPKNTYYITRISAPILGCSKLLRVSGSDHYNYNAKTLKYGALRGYASISVGCVFVLHPFQNGLHCCHSAIIL